MNRISAAILGIVLCFGLNGCSAKPKELKRVSIAFQKWVGYGLFYLGQEKGFFAQEGIELFFVDEQLDASRREAFESGILDCEAGTIDLLVSKRSLGAPVVAVLELDRSFGGDAVVVAEDIKRLEDLRGKRVAFSRDDVNETFLSYLFYQQNLTLNDITIVSRRPEEVADAFLRQEADAAVTWEPWVSKALTLPGAHILVSSAQAPEVIVDTFNIREDLLQSNPDLVKGLIRGWFKALEYYQQDPATSSQIIAKYYNLKPEEYRRDVTLLKWSSYAQQVESARAGDWERIFNLIAKLKFDLGRITRIPSAADAIDTGLIQQIHEDNQ